MVYCPVNVLSDMLQESRKCDNKAMITTKISREIISRTSQKTYHEIGTGTDTLFALLLDFVKGDCVCKGG